MLRNLPSPGFARINERCREGFELRSVVRLRPAFESFAGSGPGVGERRFGNGVFESLLGVRLRPEHG
jgi:hypothetical protein